jgi:hypothetical protein
MSTRIAAAVVIALAAATLLMFGQEKAKRPAVNIHVSGRVVTVKGAPLFSASVSIHPYTPQRDKNGTEHDAQWSHSDQAGRFTFDCQGSKKYQLLVSFAGLKNERKVVDISAKNLDIGDVVIQPCPHAEPQTTTLWQRLRRHLFSEGSDTLRPDQIVVDPATNVRDWRLLRPLEGTDAPRKLILALSFMLLSRTA